MSITWRMHAWTAAGTPRPTISVDGAIASLTRFDRNGAGNCLEASFEADPQAVTIQARDVVQLQASTDDGSTWESVYKGFATIVGSERAYGLRTYKLVGLKQRFYEIVLTESVVSGADVASMVDDALSSITLPEGVTYSSADVPTLAFELGDRYPQLETVGDFLDALAEAVGAFVVPTGSTYTYDGITYSAGDTVPAAQWGVDADGAFFFRRPQGDPVEAREGAANTMVRWDDVAAEEVVDRVTLVYASEYPADFLFQIGVGPVSGHHAETPPAQPIAYTYDSGGTYGAARVVTLDAPVDHMKDVAGPAEDVPLRPAWTNRSNATDGDSSTYAEAPAGGADFLVPAEVSSGNGVILRLRLRLSENESTDRSGMGATWNARLLVRWYDSGGARLASASGVWAPDGDAPEVDAYLAFPAPAVVGEVASMEFTVQGMGGVRAYEVNAYVVDEDAADLLAEAYMRSPNANASSVETVGSLPVVASRMRLTPVGESAVEVPVERVETRLTNEDGLVSTYYLAQAFDAEELSEKAVLEALAKRAARR